MKIAFPTFGNRDGNEKFILNIWEQEWEASIPGNGWEQECRQKIEEFGIFS